MDRSGQRATAGRVDAPVAGAALSPTPARFAPLLRPTRASVGPAAGPAPCAPGPVARRTAAQDPGERDHGGLPFPLVRDPVPGRGCHTGVRRACGADPGPIRVRLGPPADGRGALRN